MYDVYLREILHNTTIKFISQNSNMNNNIA